MTPPAPPADPLVIAVQAARLFVLPPQTFKGLTLDRADLEVLVNDDHSLFRIGAGSPWKAMLNHLHRTGLHVVVGVNIDDSLVLTIGAGQGD